MLDSSKLYVKSAEGTQPDEPLLQLLMVAQGGLPVFGTGAMQYDRVLAEAHPGLDARG